MKMNRDLRLKIVERYGTQADFAHVADHLDHFGISEEGKVNPVGRLTGENDCLPSAKVGNDSCAPRELHLPASHARPGVEICCCIIHKANFIRIYTCGINNRTTIDLIFSVVLQICSDNATETRFAFEKAIYRHIIDKDRALFLRCLQHIDDQPCRPSKVAYGS